MFESTVLSSPALPPLLAQTLDILEKKSLGTGSESFSWYSPQPFVLPPERIILAKASDMVEPRGAVLGFAHF